MSLKVFLSVVPVIPRKQNVTIIKATFGTKIKTTPLMVQYLFEIYLLFIHYIDQLLS